MATAVIGFAANLGGIFSKILHAGHADDAVGQADGEAAKQILGPIFGAVLGHPVDVSGGYIQIDPATDQVIIMAQQNQWPLSSQQTQQLLDAGNQATAAACAQFAQAGYPCHAYVEGKSGAGTFLFTKWERLKSGLVLGLAVATAREQRDGPPPIAVNPGQPSVFAPASTGLAAQFSPANGVGGGSPGVPPNNTVLIIIVGGIGVLLLFLFLMLR